MTTGSALFWIIVMIMMLLLLLPVLLVSLHDDDGDDEKDNKDSNYRSKRLEFVPYYSDDDNGGNGRQVGGYRFRIAQITDIHLGEAEDTTWGPEQDRKTWIALDRFLTGGGGGTATKKKKKFDLIVLSGDQITSNNVDSNATEYYELLATKMDSHGIPWAVIFGNHDDAPLERKDPKTGARKYYPAKTTRMQLADVVVHNRRRQLQYSVTQIGPKNLPGVSNYWLDVHLPRRTTDERNNTVDVVAARVLLLDTGGGSLKQRVTQSQVEWFLNTKDKNKDNTITDIPIVAFQHIPSQPNSGNNDTGFEYISDRCGGGGGGDGDIMASASSSSNSSNSSAPFSTSSPSLHDDDVTPVEDGDAGLTQILADSGDVLFLAVGHDHGNDYCCPHRRRGSGGAGGGSSEDDKNHDDDNDMRLCFGRHSGYGGYGSWARGIRVYQIDLDGVGGRFRRWSSHVELEDGSVVGEYGPYYGPGMPRRRGELTRHRPQS